MTLVTQSTFVALQQCLGYCESEGDGGAEADGNSVMVIIAVVNDNGGR